MTLNEIKQMIEKAIPDSVAYIVDPQHDGQHLEALVIAPIFKELSLLEQQRKVMDAGPIFKTVHAMSLKTFTPERWKLEKNKYNYED